MTLPHFFKRNQPKTDPTLHHRIVVASTQVQVSPPTPLISFSIHHRIVVASTKSSGALEIIPSVTFSIHHRIVVASTAVSSGFPSGVGFFQYPPSDRRCFNPVCRPVSLRPFNFQYPPSDRRCFNDVQTFVGQYGESFSIHHRIVVASTDHEQPGEDRHHIFQYPPSDRRCFNILDQGVPYVALKPFSIHHRIVVASTKSRLRLPVKIAALSVSTIGSSLLQPVAAGRFCLRRLMLSVSTIGSSLLQPARPSKAYSRPLFQYPPSDRRCFNLRMFVDVLATAVFQYPPSDRRCFNSATGRGRTGGPCFQYPPSDRRCFNICAQRTD